MYWLNQLFYFYSADDYKIHLKVLTTYIVLITRLLM